MSLGRNPADSLACGHGSERTQHPSELFGADWMEWESPLLQAQDQPLAKKIKPEGPA